LRLELIGEIAHAYDADFEFVCGQILCRLDKVGDALAFDVAAYKEDFELAVDRVGGVRGLAERCAAVLQAWYPGEEGGNAVADILFGHVSPSAKLSVSYPNTEIYEPLCYNYTAEKDPRVQWPFGFGLSYTTFAYDNLKAPVEVTTDTPFVNLSFEVKNTGEVAATEIAQVYLSPTDASQPIRPIQLQGFARVTLQPGESKTVQVKLTTEQFGYYSHEGTRQWNIQLGTFLVKVGASSTDIRLQQAVTLKGQPISKPLRETYLSEASL
jgi:beta-glucosidase